MLLKIPFTIAKGITSNVAVSGELVWNQRIVPKSPNRQSSKHYQVFFADWFQTQLSRHLKDCGLVFLDWHMLSIIANTQLRANSKSTIQYRNWVNSLLFYIYLLALNAVSVIGSQPSPIIMLGVWARLSQSKSVHRLFCYSVVQCFGYCTWLRQLSSS